MTERITFGQLEAVLADLGFKKTVIPGSHVNFEHPEAGMIAPVRLYKARELASRFALAGIRHDLEVLGVVNGSQFDEMLKAVAA